MGDGVNAAEDFEKDERVACRYGSECYQKNPVHREKFKHPPTADQESTVKTAAQSQKRENPETSLPEAKHQKTMACSRAELHAADSAAPPDSSDSSDSSEDDLHPAILEASDEEIRQIAERIKLPTTTGRRPRFAPEKYGEAKAEGVSNNAPPYHNTVPQAQKDLIRKLFHFDMPDDFYEFYELCKSISPGNAGRALQDIGLELVGPFDVLMGKIKDTEKGNGNKWLRHWRYFYDLPEFQTVLKGNDKEGLHFGYWRDQDDKPPAFVVQNLAMVDSKITPVAETLVSAVMSYAKQYAKKCTPFQTHAVGTLMRKIREFARRTKVSMDTETPKMRERNRKSVTKTLHGAGIVVPFNKTTQIGYRTLSATDSQLKKILEKLEDEDEEVRKEHMAKIDEIIRLATIAADESDFGTPLELAHDLFISGIPSVHERALQMFQLAYGLLYRPIFLKIIRAHLEDRISGCRLSSL